MLKDKKRERKLSLGGRQGENVQKETRSWIQEKIEEKMWT